MEHLLNLGAFNLDRILEHEPDFLKGEHHHHHHEHEHEHEHHKHHEHDHEHDSSITSVGLRIPGDLNEKKLNDWIRDLLSEQGQGVFRIKGILSIKGEPLRFVFQGVHMQLDGRLDRPWKPVEIRQNTLVFNGRNLDRKKLEEGFRTDLGGVHAWSLDPATGKVLGKGVLRGGTEGQTPATNDVLAADAKGEQAWLFQDAALTTDAQPVKMPW